MSEVVSVASVIEKVEVFRSQALVTRRGRFQLPAAGGPTIVRLPGLPLLLFDSSVRARLLEAGRGRIADLHLELDLGERKGAQRTTGEEKVRALERRRATVLAERQQELERVQFIESLTPSAHAVEDLPEKLAFEPRHPVRAMLDLAGFVREELLSAREQTRALERKLRDLQDEISEARQQMRKESQAEKERLKVCRKTARLLIEKGAAGQQQGVEISYLVPAACWFPQYELRVFEGQNQAELLVLALVAQKTGEDWPRAEMAFSTADLARSPILPELDSWRIGKPQPLRRSGWKELPDNLAELFEGYDRGVRQIAAPRIPKSIPLPQMPAVVPTEKEARRAKNDLPGDMDLVRDARQSRAEPLGFTLSRSIDTGRLAEAAAEPMDDAVCLSVPPPAAPVTASMQPCGAPAAEFVEKRMPARARPAKAQKSERSQVQSQQRTIRSRMATMAFDADLSEAEEEVTPAGGEQAPGPEVRLPATIAAGENALAFAQLCMASPEDREGRGQLRATGPAEHLAGQLAELSPDSAEAVRRLPPRALLEIFGAADSRLDHLRLPRNAVPIADSAGHFAVRYQAEGPSEILADGELHSLTLLRREGGIRRSYRCVPALDRQVYQMAVFENPLALPLLSGGVKVYREGDFVVDAPLETTPPGKPITVNLGVEPAIAVARNTHFEETTAGLLGGDTVLTHQIEIEVHSKLQEPVLVEVFERIPVSHEEDLKVTLVNSSPKAEPYDQKDRGALVHGGHRFAIDLGPKEKKVCKLTYRIVIPSKRVLVGGNRRD